MDNNIMSSDIEDKIRNRYIKRFHKYGYSPESLGWSKNKQNMRFHALTSNLECKDASILDIGCGFGDLIQYLNSIQKGMMTSSYCGIDLVPEFIQTARERYTHSSNVSFETGNFLDMCIETSYDYVISCGIFNHINYGVDMYTYIEKAMKKAFSICNRAIAMDFLSDYVNYKNEENFYSKPEKILEIAYSLSRNIILKSDYFPFEFCIIINKDDSYHPQTTYFNSLHSKYNDLFESGIFSI